MLALPFQDPPPDGVPPVRTYGLSDLCRSWTHTRRDNQGRTGLGWLSACSYPVDCALAMRVNHCYLGCYH